MDELRVETERLLLLPMSYEFMNALLDNRPTELEEQGYTLSEGWINLEVLNYVDILHSLIPEDRVIDGFYTWVIIERQARRIIGDVGFKGRPNELGVVDIGYGLAPAERGKHYATEAVRALLTWVFSQSGVRRVSAECAEDNIASIRILTNMGMQEMMRDGSTIFWELKKDQFVL